MFLTRTFEPFPVPRFLHPGVEAEKEVIFAKRVIVAEAALKL
jgi:hypothetical protein